LDPYICFITTTPTQAGKEQNASKCSAGKQRAADDHDAANVILLSLLTLAAEHFLLEHVSGIVRIQ
jgi:hypothetical protein